VLVSFFYKKKYKNNKKEKVKSAPFSQTKLIDQNSD